MMIGSPGPMMQLAYLAKTVQWLARLEAAVEDRVAQPIHSRVREFVERPYLWLTR
jgi:hypothetical protein